MLKFISIPYFNYYRLKILLGNEEIGQGSYRKDEGEIFLTWVEINEQHQRKGHGTKVLDYFANMAIKYNISFKIQVVDESLLSDFYLKWYSKWAESKDINEKIIKKNFNQCVIEGSNPMLEFTIEQLNLENNKENIKNKQMVIGIRFKNDS